MHLLISLIKLKIKNIVEEVMAMRTKVLMFVGLFLVSVLGISTEVNYALSNSMQGNFDYVLNAKIFDYGQNIVSIEIDTKGKGRTIREKRD